MGVGDLVVCAPIHVISLGILLIRRFRGRRAKNLRLGVLFWEADDNPAVMIMGYDNIDIDHNLLSIY